MEKLLNNTHYWLEKSYDTTCYWVIKLTATANLFSSNAIGLALSLVILGSLYSGANFIYQFPWYFGRWAMVSGSSNYYNIPTEMLAKGFLGVSSLESYFQATPYPPSIWRDVLGLPWYVKSPERESMNRYLKVEKILKEKQEFLGLLKHWEEKILQLTNNLLVISKTHNLNDLKEEQRYKTVITESDVQYSQFGHEVWERPGLVLKYDRGSMRVDGPPFCRQIRVWTAREEDSYSSLKGIKYTEKHGIGYVEVILEERKNVYGLEGGVRIHQSNLYNSEFLRFLKENPDKILGLVITATGVVICPDFLLFLIKSAPYENILADYTIPLLNSVEMWREYFMEKMMQTEKTYTPEIVQQVLDYLPRQQEAPSASVLEKKSFVDYLPKIEMSNGSGDPDPKAPWWLWGLVVGGALIMGAVALYASQGQDPKVLSSIPEISNYLEIKSLKNK